MEEQKVRSRGAEISSKEKREQRWGNLDASISPLAKAQPIFVGYTQLQVETEVEVSGKDYVVLKQNPFYAESGGQVNDLGYLRTKDGRVIEIDDVEKYDRYSFPKLPENHGLRFKEIVLASVQKDRRQNIERNHSATHLVHEALRRVLGTHAHQQGSLVAPDHLRFDFNHFEKITPDQLRAIEEIVNEKIAENIGVFALNDPKDWLTIDEAKKRYPNVKMFFGDKYGDKVRIVEIDPKFSVELCGGTHVKNTRDIGLFKIVSESSIASGIRRIEAVTGDGLRHYIDERVKRIGELDEHLGRLAEELESLEKSLGRPRSETGARSAKIGSPLPPTRESISLLARAEEERNEAIESAAKLVSDRRKVLSKIRVKDAASGIESMIAGGTAVDGFKVVSARIDVENADELKNIGDTLRSKIASGVGVLGAVVDQKVALVCVVTDDLIKEKKLLAGKIVGELARRVGGGGGGRPHLATAGGKDVGKLDETLRQTAEIVKGML